MLRVGATVTAIAATYVVFWVLQANHFLGALLKGRYGVYYVTYIAVLAVLISIESVAVRAARSAGVAMLRGVGLGHLAGIVGYCAVALSMGGVGARLARSAELLGWNIWILFFMPGLYLGWAYGALTAWGVFHIERRILCRRMGAGRSPR